MKPHPSQSEHVGVEADAIGKWLEENPPWGFRDRYSAMGWAAIAQAVLNARASIRKAP